MLSGKRVGSRNIDNNCHKCSHNYVSNRVTVAGPQLCIARQLFVSFEVNSFRKEHNLSVGYGCRITERCNDDEVHRIQGDDDQKHADRIQDDIENQSSLDFFTLFVDTAFALLISLLSIPM